MLRELKLPAGFSVVEMGSQRHHQGKRSIGGKPNPEFWSRPAVDLYRELGCGRYESLDANGEATRTVDLNHPLSKQREGLGLGQFDLVTDFGTTEHCWNVGQAWISIHELTKPGGLIVFDKPCERYPSHGFYLFDKMFFVAMARANQYKTLMFKRVVANRGACWRGILQKPDGEDKPFSFGRQGKWRWQIENDAEVAA